MLKSLAAISAVAVCCLGNELPANAQSWSDPYGTGYPVQQYNGGPMGGTRIRVTPVVPPYQPKFGPTPTYDFNVRPY